MYIPKHYEGKGEDRAIEFIKKFNFGLLLSNSQGQINATHLPFVVDEIGGRVIISSHMARANSQWEDMDGETVKLIFSEPHAYITPRLYEKDVNVPTWNFIAVHVKGKVSVVKDETALITLMENMIEKFDSNFMPQWKSLPKEYTAAMFKGVIGFQVIPDQIEFKEKLSQNKTDSEKENIIVSLSNSENSNEREIANYMRQLMEISNS